MHAGREGAESLLVIEQARFLELLLQAYSTERDGYTTNLRAMFAAADGDGDGEIDKDDFVNLMKLAVPGWTVGQSKDVFWRAVRTAPASDLARPFGSRRCSDTKNCVVGGGRRRRWVWRCWTARR